MAVPVLRSTLSLFALAVLTGGLSVGAAEGSLEGRVSTAVGVDTNPTRDFLSPATPAPRAEGVLSATAALQGKVLLPALSLQGAYEAGGRAFVTTTEADTLVQQASAQLGWAADRALSLGALLSGRDREGERPYSALLGLGTLLVMLDGQAHASVELGAGARRFLYRGDAERFGYSFGTALYQGTGRYRFDAHHTLALGMSVEPRRYSALAVGTDQKVGTAQRRDSVLEATLSYGYRGPLFGYRRPFRLNLAYAFTQQSSNSLGQTNSRHHLSLEVGVQLPARFSLLAQGALQFARYPDALPLNAGLVLLEDDENTNFASVKLVHPLVEQLDLELRYGFYSATFPRNDFSYRRQLVALGLVFRF